MTAILDIKSSRAAKKQHDSIVAWTWEQFTRMKNARTIIERQWYLDLSFYFGKQHVAFIRPGQRGFAAGSTKLWIPPAPYWRARPVINRIRPTIRTEIAQLTNNKPNATVVPASAEERDMYAAMAAEQIWESIYTDKKLKAIFRRAVWWNQVCGNSYIKTWWDFTKGEIDPETETPVGDICFAHVTPFHVFVPDLLEEEIEDQPYIIHAQAKSPEYIKMRYKTGVDGEQIKTVETTGREILEESFLNLIGNSSVTDKQRSVLEFEVWVKPGMHPNFPDGAMFTVVGNKIVQDFAGLPYSHGKYPFAKLDHIPSGKYYTTSSVEDLISLQKEYNRTHGQIMENKNRMAKLQLMAERGAVDASKMTSEPGQLIEYTPGFNPPQPAPAPPLPSYVMETLDRILQDWNDISGQHEVTHGQVPPGVTAATAISFLQERDETKHSPTFDSLEEGIEKTAQMALSYVNQFWSTERMIRVTGPEGSFDTLAMKGSDLDNALDIRVEAGSALPVSKAAKQALIMDLMKMGFIDPQQGLEVMDMGGINKLYEQIQVDQRQIQRENLRMSKVDVAMLQQQNQLNMQMMQANPNAFDGAMPPLIIPVNTWDNHKLHVMHHNNYRKSQAFEVLPKEVKALFEAHVQQHVAALGIETESMNPRDAAGLPPDPMMDGGGSGGQQQIQDQTQSNPGPEPMPQLSGGAP